MLEKVFTVGRTRDRCIPALYHGGGINQACRIDVTSRLSSLHNRSSVRRARKAIARRETQGRNARQA